MSAVSFSESDIPLLVTVDAGGACPPVRLRRGSAPKGLAVGSWQRCAGGDPADLLQLLQFASFFVGRRLYL